MQSPLPEWTAVSRTAWGVARIRAAETRRPDALFDDPYAQAFERAAGAGPTAPDGHDGRQMAARRRLYQQVVLRTRYYDDWLRRLVSAGCRQLAILGAGLDTRAYRLPLSAEVTVFELDLPPVLDFKQRVLDDAGAKPACLRRAVAADATSEDWPDRLTAAGFDPGRPSAWLLEGLLAYLQASEARRLLERVSALAAPGSELATERGERAAAAAKSAGPQAAGAGAAPEVARLWRGGLGSQLAGWLDSHGWTSRDQPLAELAARYGRTNPDQETAGALLTATRLG